MPQLDLPFEAPGPGVWATDSYHTPRPLSPLYTQTVPPGFTRGFDESNRLVGAFAGGPVYATVHAFRYARGTSVPDPLVGELSREAFDARVRASDEAQLRIVNATRFFEDRLWRAELRRWDTVMKPACIAANRTLATVDPAALDDAALLTHLSACLAQLQFTSYVHQAFISVHTVFGDFFRQTADWIGGLEPGLAELLGGASTVSAGEPHLLAALAAALRAQPDARARLATGDAGEALHTVRAIPGEAGRLLNEYVLLTGYRTVGGFDCADAYALEAPAQFREIVLRAIDAPPAADAPPPDPAPYRARVPEAHRAAFDDSLAEARLIFRLKDERVMYTDAAACGLVRRALLAAGARLAERGLIADPEHAVLADEPELRDLFAGRAGSIADTLRARFEFRETYSVRDIPATLGTPDWQPPVDWLPDPVRRVTLANAAANQVMGGTTRFSEQSITIKGITGSLGTYRGTARLVRGPADFARIQHGDVLVTTSTNPGFTMVLPLVGALVTDIGGALSHAAIVARESRIPAVVGCGNATASIPDGATVLVDAAAGTVTIEQP